MVKPLSFSPDDCILPENTPKLIQRYAHLFCALSKSSVSEARKLIKVAPTGFIKALALVAKNILHKKIVLSGRLDPTPYSKQIRKLALKRLSAKQKKLVLNQRAGFINFLLPIISAIVPILLHAL